MAERRATNKYYPPDFDPSVHGSVNSYQGSHPLRERAKRLSDGILKIRFELPFNIFCNKCNSHIGKGVRFNADKKCVGNYYSTKIWQFTMRCPTCSNELIITTNPQAAEYEVTAGGKRKNEEFSAEDSETIKINNDTDKEKMRSNAFFYRQKTSENEQQLQEGAQHLAALQEVQSSLQFDYDANARARTLMRHSRNKLKDKETERKKAAWSFQLADPSTEDSKNAKRALEEENAKKQADGSIDDQLNRKTKAQSVHILHQPIFDSSSSTLSSEKSKALQLLQRRMQLGLHNSFHVISSPPSQKRKKMEDTRENEQQNRSTTSTSTAVPLAILHIHTSKHKNQKRTPNSPPNSSATSSSNSPSSAGSHHITASNSSLVSSAYDSNSDNEIEG